MNTDHGSAQEDSLVIPGRRAHRLVSTDPSATWMPVILDLAKSVPDIWTGDASHLYVHVLWRGQMLGRHLVVAPSNPMPADQLLASLIGLFAEDLAELRATELLTPPPLDDSPRFSGTVVVCTRNRQTSLRRCLESLSSVAYTPIDVIVVDNGDGLDGTRELVQHLGYRWVHEPAPGLDRARNRGLLEATGDVVLFADDDVAVRPDWAVNLLRCFDDPVVGAAGGLVLPADLTSAEQRTLELHYGFGRGFRRRVLDGALHPPTTGGSQGAGASMAVRRALMINLGGFPEELDAGMPTRSGGDTYAFYRILREGYRAVYEPRAMSLHWHRDGATELARTVSGYSTGTYSFLLYALLHDRDPRALRAVGKWSRTWVLRRLVSSVRGDPEAPPIALAWGDLKGALRAPVALWQAKRVVRRRGRLTLPSVSDSTPPPVPPPAASAAATPRRQSISVIIPVRPGRRPPRAIVADLHQQTTPPTEVLLVVGEDEADTSGAPPLLSPEIALRMVAARSSAGLAGARNAGLQAAHGDFVLFLGDSTSGVDRRLITEHLVAHERHASPVAAVGMCYPESLPGESPLLFRLRNEMVDRATALSTSTELMPDNLDANHVSIRRELLTHLGGFRNVAGRGGFELGLRLESLSIPSVPVTGTFTTRGWDDPLRDRLAERWEEGKGEFLTAEEHPEVAPAFLLGEWPDLSALDRARIGRLFGSPITRAGQLALARNLVVAHNLARARGRLNRALDRALFLAYWGGVAEASGSARRLEGVLRCSADATLTRRSGTAHLDLSAPRWDTPAPVVSRIVLTAEGRPIATVPRHWGGFPWSSSTFSRRLLSELPREELQLALSAGRSQSDQ